MRHQLKDHYGRRITPGVKVFILVAIVFLGLYLVFGASGHGARKTHAVEVWSNPTLKQIPSNT